MNVELSETLITPFILNGGTPLPYHIGGLSSDVCESEETGLRGKRFDRLLCPSEAIHSDEAMGHRDRYRRRSPSPRGYRGGGGRDSYRDSYRRRSPPAPYYNRPRRTPPRSGTTLFVAGLNFVTTERVGPLLYSFPSHSRCGSSDVKSQA